MGAPSTRNVAVIGSGPAGLMAADVLSSAGASVTLFEKRKGMGRKLLIAGSSGLNITNSLPVSKFVSHYTGPMNFWERVIGGFTPQDWIAFIERSLGIATFEGTSGRYFVENMKAAGLLQAWTQRLAKQGITLRQGLEIRGIRTAEGQAVLSCSDG